MVSPVQVPRPRVRHSLVSPIVLIAIGIIFLLGTMGVLDWVSFGHWFAHYWPVLLILWGVLKLVEYQQAQNDGVRYSGIGAGGVFLLILLIGFGIVSTQASRLDWEALGEHFNIDDDNFFDHTKLFGPSYNFNDEVTQTFPSSAKLNVTSDRGNVTIQDSDDGQLKVMIAKKVHAHDQQAADKLNASSKPKINTSGNVVTIDANTQGAGDHGLATDLTISVPKNASVEINARHGDVRVIGRDADADITSAHGSVSAEDIKGKLALSLDHSSAHVSQIASDVSVRGHANDVSLDDIQGSVRLEGDFMESVKLSKIAKPVSFKSSRTDIEFSKLDGSLDLDSGDLKAANLVGPLRLSTRSKDINLSGVTGDVRVSNENGTVELHMRRIGSMQVDNRQGDIQIYLPEKTGFQVDARARNGEIQSDFAEITVKDGDDQGTATGNVSGGGPHLVLNNEHGGIEIHKASPADADELGPSIPKMPKVPRVPTPKVPTVNDN